MKSEDFFKFDSSLQLVHGCADRVKLAGISQPEDPASFSLIFLKNKKFADKFFSNLNNTSLESIILIVDIKFFNEYFKTNYKYDDLVVLTSSNVPLALAKISKYFYDQIYDSLYILKIKRIKNLH